MPKQFLLIVLTLTALISPSCATAQDVSRESSGNSLYEKYQSYKVGRLDYRYGSYTGFISGFVEAESVRSGLGNTPIWCSPKDAVFKQYFDVVGQFLEKYPARRNEHQVALVVDALRGAWPCQ